MPIENLSCEDPSIEDRVSCRKIELEELKENLRNSSRMRVEEKASVSQQIDQITESLEELKKEQGRDCAKVTWSNIIMHKLFGKNDLCI